MDSTTKIRVTPRLIVGLGILAFGVLWTLDNLDILEAEQYVEWWPAVLIAVGLVRLLDPMSGKAGSVILIAIGSVLLLDSLDYLDVDLFDLIPVIIALVGAKLIWDTFRRREAARSGERDPNSTVRPFAMWAGVKRQITSKEFRGGEATAIMGGVELDLREATIKDGQAVIDVFALMGGIELRVPENWTIVPQAFPIMGAVEDKTRLPKEPGPQLLIKGMVIMGGVEVKN